MAAHKFNIYIWMVDTIASGPITKPDFDRRWVRCRYNDAHESIFPMRRFQRYKEDIQQLFDIDIICRKRGRVYYYMIENRDSMQNAGMRQWLLSNFAVQSLLDESEDLRDSVLYEQIPSGTQYLSTIVNAIRNREQLIVTYQKFNDLRPYEMIFCPYCLKVFRQRWYMAGVRIDSPDHPGVRTYALDRVQSVQTRYGAHFDMPADFDAHRFFANYYGIYRDAEPCPIQIRCSKRSADYLRSLPLHPSQVETERTAEYSVFEFFMAPTLELIQEFRTHGHELQVLAPASLVAAFRAEAEQLHLLYS